jgi:hypothetical protein
MFFEVVAAEAEALQRRTLAPAEGWGGLAAIGVRRNV